MSSIEQLLEELGLADYTLVELSPPHDVAEGHASNQIAAVMLALMMSPWVADKADLAGEPTGTAQQVSVSSFGGALRVVGLPDALVTQVADDTLQLDFSKLTADTSPFALLIEGAAGLFLVPRDGRAAVISSDDSEPLQLGPAPDASMITDLATEDEWLSKLYDVAVKSDDTFAVCAAAGIVLQHRVERDPALVTKRLLAGEPDPLREAVKHWALALTDDVAQRLEQLALTECDMVEQALADLWQDIDADEVGEESSVQQRLRRMTALAARRVHLEGALTVLVLRPPESAVVGRALAGIDRLGNQLVQAMPVLPAGETSELLRRARLSDPDDWWAQLLD